MSKQPRTALIGGFVLGGIALLFFAIILFGAGEFFVEKKTYVLYFDGSLAGLAIGAPVTLRGVKVGEVSNIIVEVNRDDISIKLPVYIELDSSRIVAIGGDSHPKKDNIKKFIGHGLRAELKTQSFVTGQLNIELDFYPETPLKLAADKSGYIQIPTIPSQVEKLAAMLEDVKEVISGLNEIINSPEAKELIVIFNKAIKHTDKFISDLDYQVDPIAVDLQKALRAFANSSLAVQVFTKYLAQHPEALLQGKPKE